MSNRRDFLALAGIAGCGVVLPGIAAGAEISHKEKLDYIRKAAGKKHVQTFNMSGYAAPKLDTVRIGYIGVGNRGSGAVKLASGIGNVEVVAVCDVVQEKVDSSIKSVEGKFKPTPYVGKDAWKKVCERDDIDLIYICTPWEMHAPMAIYAMKQGKHAAVEIPAAITLDECWELVETSEKTKKHCMMLENTCYDFFEMMTLNMARHGFFGEVIHVEGAYLHDIFESLFNKDARWNLWRLRNNFISGSLYPTHGLGPICQILNVNCGDKMDYMVSMSSEDFMMKAKAEEMAKTDPDFEEFVKAGNFRGNMSSSIIKTAKGKTILVQHDVSSPRPYSRLHTISGTKASAQKYPLPGRVAVGHEWLKEDEIKELEEKYTPELIRKVGTMAKEVGGHGGIDYLLTWRMIDCLRNGLPLDQSVYDAASWSSIIPLSKWSTANGSRPINIPDFTNGKWKTNKEFDLTLTGGGTTAVCGKMIS